ncbi:MAG: hypothetical protein LAO31_17100 [Acidobacteriia bacterium]|nr:hypothetical protein [Terriglobia bacterium]
MQLQSLFSLTVLLVAASLAPLPTHAQGGGSSVDEYNIPKEVETCVKESLGLTINGDMNPFYLSADFDGDGKLDFAVQVTRSDTKGILICLSSQKAPLTVGAGSSLVWPSNQKWRFNAWSIVPKESTAVSRPTKAKHDAILLDIKETANGLLYWDGTKLRWEQLSD